MHVACCIIKATDTQTEYVILFFSRRKYGWRSRPGIALYVLCLSCGIRSPGSEESIVEGTCTSTNPASQADSCCIRSLYVILSRTGLLLHLVAVSNSATVCYLSLYTINEQFNGPWTNEKHWKVLRWFKLLSGFIFISPQNYCHVSMSFQNSTHKQNVTRLSITTFFSSGIGLFYDFQMSVTDCWICVITSQ